MKSYNNLWATCISDANIRASIRGAANGKRKRTDVQRKLADEDYISKIRRYAENFKNAKHKPKEIYDGVRRKKRTIIVPTFDEQVVHHMVVNTLKPVILRGAYAHAYGSIPRKGIHQGKRTVERWIKHGGKNCKYVLKMDIQKFYDSIPHGIILARLRKVIRDRRFLALVEEIISATETGLPLGFYTSQWLAYWYLQPLDHYIKEELGAETYERYVDDMVIFGGNKRRLHRMREAIDAFLRERLGLKLKSNWQVFRFDFREKYRFLDFLGFRFYRNRTTLRKSIMLRVTRTAAAIYKAAKPSLRRIRQMLCYAGWLKHSDTYGMYVSRVKPLVDLQSLKRRIRRHERTQNAGRHLVHHRGDELPATA